MVHLGHRTTKKRGGALDKKIQMEEFSLCLWPVQYSVVLPVHQSAFGWEEKKCVFVCCLTKGNSYCFDQRMPLIATVMMVTEPHSALLLLAAELFMKDEKLLSFSLRTYQFFFKYDFLVLSYITLNTVTYVTFNL